MSKKFIRENKFSRKLIPLRYWFNKKELLQKAKEKYDNGGKEKAAEYYQANKTAIKKAKNRNKNLSEEEK